MIVYKQYQHLHHVIYKIRLCIFVTEPQRVELDYLVHKHQLV